MSKDPQTATKLPPGMVMGPDGKPCRACNSLQAFKGSQHFKKDPNSKTATAVATAAALGATSECPPDSEQLGRSTWTFLHTAAAYYPVNPSPQHRRNMLSLLQSLPTLYPCGYCAEHLGVEMQKNPPDVSGREQLSKWLCGVHNEVNERLGKPQFDCSQTLERWKDGPKDGSCD